MGTLGSLKDPKGPPSTIRVLPGALETHSHVRFSLHSPRWATRSAPYAASSLSASTFACLRRTFSASHAFGRSGSDALMVGGFLCALPRESKGRGKQAHVISIKPACCSEDEARIADQIMTGKTVALSLRSMASGGWSICSTPTARTDRAAQPAQVFDVRLLRGSF